MKNLMKGLIGLAVVILVYGMAQAQFANPQEAIKYRKSVMFLTAAHFKPMGAMVQEKVPYDKAVFAKNAAVLEMLATLPWEAMMAPESDKGDTTLNSAVFEKSAEFKKIATSFQDDAAKLSQLAAAGDFDGVKAQFGSVAASCKGCHSQFRSK